LRGGGKKNNKKLRAWYTHCLSVLLADSKIEDDGVSTLKSSMKLLLLQGEIVCNQGL